MSASAIAIPFKRNSKKTDNDFFNEVNDLFIGNTRQINPKYLGIKNISKSKIDSKIDGDGYCYVLNARGTDLYKIGISEKFNRRFRDISSSSPLPLLIVLCIRVKNPNEMEDYLHDRYKNQYFKNDWFNLDAENVKELVHIFNIVDVTREGD